MMLLDVCILIPEIYEYISLNDEREFAEMDKLMIWRWGDYPRGPDRITRVLMKGGQREV